MRVIVPSGLFCFNPRSGNACYPDGTIDVIPANSFNPHPAVMLGAALRRVWLGWWCGHNLCQRVLGATEDKSAYPAPPVQSSHPAVMLGATSATKSHAKKL